MNAAERKVYAAAVRILLKLEALLARGPQTDDNRDIARAVAKTRMLLEILR